MSAAEKFDYILCTRKNGTKFIKIVHYSCEFDLRRDRNGLE